MKRRLTVIFLLNFWSNFIYSVFTPYSPVNHGSDYFFFVLVLVTSSFFALMITRRKYRLPRKYIINVSLICFLISMILLSVLQETSSASAEITILVISKIFMGLGWASAIYVNITLLCYLYTRFFQTLFAVLQVFTLLGYIIGYSASMGNGGLRQVTIPSAVISGLLLIPINFLLDDLSYPLTQERYSLTSFLYHKKQILNIVYLTCIFMSKAFIVYGIYENLLDQSPNDSLVLFCVFIEIFGGLFSLVLSCFINFTQEKRMPLLIIGLLYSFSFIVLAPWTLIMPNEIWISSLGLLVNGILSYLLIVNITVKIYYYSINIYSFTFEALVCECVSSSYLLSFSVGGILGPVIGLILSTFLQFTHASVVIGFLCLTITVLYFRLNKQSLLGLNAVETEPAQADAPINRNPQKAHLEVPSALIEPTLQTPGKRNVTESKIFVYPPENFSDPPTPLYSESTEKAYGNISLPLAKLRSLSEENSLKVKSTPKEEVSNEAQEVSKEVVKEMEKENEENEKPREKGKYLTLPPIFKEQVRIELDVPIAFDESKSKSESFHKSKDVIKDFSGLFPENPYDESYNK